MDEPLAKGAIESSSGWAGFTPNIFVVPKYMGDLECPILNLKLFNHYMKIPTFKMPIIRQVRLLA